MRGLEDKGSEEIFRTSVCFTSCMDFITLLTSLLECVWHSVACARTTPIQYEKIFRRRSSVNELLIVLYGINRFPAFRTGPVQYFQ